MKKYKYFPFYFFGFLCFFIISQRINLVAYGTPFGGHSWSQIWGKLPYFTICTAIMAFISNQVTNEIIKNQKSNAIKAKERLAEREKYYSAPNTHECRVCGCYCDEFPWGEDGKSPSYQLCPCCGVQFGKEDETLASIKEYRDEWVSKGREWFVNDEKPEHWDRDAQLKDIPDEFR